MRRRVRGIGESYGSVKLSISLPAEAAAWVREVAASTGVPVSRVIADSIEQAIEEREQARLDAALLVDAEEAVAWSEATAAVQARVIERLEW